MNRSMGPTPVVTLNVPGTVLRDAGVTAPGMSAITQSVELRASGTAKPCVIMPLMVPERGRRGNLNGLKAETAKRAGMEAAGKMRYMQHGRMAQNLQTDARLWKIRDNKGLGTSSRAAQQVHNAEALRIYQLNETYKVQGFGIRNFVTNDAGTVVSKAALIPATGPRRGIGRLRRLIPSMNYSAKNRDTLGKNSTAKQEPGLAPMAKRMNVHMLKNPAFADYLLDNNQLKIVKTSNGLSMIVPSESSGNSARKRLMELKTGLQQRNNRQTLEVA